MKAAFIFSGQGAQTVGMGKDLVEHSPAAAAIFKEADAALDWAVSDVCFNGPAEKLTESKYCQPSIYTTSAACLAAFQEKYPEIHPVAAAGLSLGEYAALYCAGYFSFRGGLQILEKRAMFMAEACVENPGGMASVLGSTQEIIQAVCEECQIDIANYNCPGQIVISGKKDGIEKAVALLKEKGARRVIPLTVAGAFHSRLMAGAGKKLSNAGIQAEGAMRIPVAQNYIGGIVKNQDKVKENLIHQVAGSVRWDDCVREIMTVTGADTFIEFGPGAVLSGLVRKITPGTTVMNVSSFADLEKLAL